MLDIIDSAFTFTSVISIFFLLSLLFHLVFPQLTENIFRLCQPLIFIVPRHGVVTVVVVVVVVVIIVVVFVFVISNPNSAILTLPTSSVGSDILPGLCGIIIVLWISEEQEEERETLIIA